MQPSSGSKLHYRMSLHAKSASRGINKWPMISWKPSSLAIYLFPALLKGNFTLMSEARAQSLLQDTSVDNIEKEIWVATDSRINSKSWYQLKSSRKVPLICRCWRQDTTYFKLFHSLSRKTTHAKTQSHEMWNILEIAFFGIKLFTQTKEKLKVNSWNTTRKLLITARSVQCISRFRILIHSKYLQRLENSKAGKKKPQDRLK